METFSGHVMKFESLWLSNTEYEFLMEKFNFIDKIQCDVSK